MPKPPKFSPETPRHAVRMTCEVPQSKKSRTAQDVASAARKGCVWPAQAIREGLQLAVLCRSPLRRDWSSRMQSGNAIGRSSAMQLRTYLIASEIWRIRLLISLVWRWLLRHTSRSSQIRESRHDGQNVVMGNILGPTNSGH